MRRLVWLTGLLAACAVPYVGDGVDTDTDVDSDAVETDVEETDVEESDTPEEEPDPEPVDSGWGDDEEDDTEDPLAGLPPLGCHPFDSVESAAGWVRRYDVRFGNDAGTEVQTGVGWDVVPAGWAGSVDEGWAYDIVVTGTRDANYEGRVWTVCDHGGVPGAYEIAWSKAIQGGLLGQTTITLRAAARSPRQYLTDEADMIGGFPQWTEGMRYDLTQIGGTILPGGNSAELRHDGTYVGFGLESVTVPAGTFPEAVHMVVSYTDEKVSAGGFLDQFFGIFDALFGSLFGFSNGATTVTVESHRWYVRGIGLVKESTTDVTGAPISTHELARCSGLPACP